MVRAVLNRAGGVTAHLIKAFVGAGFALSVAVPVAVAQDNALGEFKSWVAMSFGKGDKNSCMLWSQPEKSEGNYQRRGEVFVFVTHRPAEKSFNRITYDTGYNYQEGSEVTLKIGKVSFRLQTHGTTAWTLSPEDDRKIIAAMRGGRQMTVQGVSARGTKTQDTFSLYGFSAAHRAIGKACKA